MSVGPESSIKVVTEQARAKQSSDPDDRDTVLPSMRPTWVNEDSIETWPESEPPEAETLRPPAGEVPEELPPDSDDMRDTVPSPPPPAGAIKNN
ncbi:MAG TPA: hypothetical protein PKA88_18905 [Polyangiaceae bacterium]|nr:hypothetical protein [Polyangiaceae bacterium]HMR77836.1 hypothetical protein [Polyangiaceae bacterium]